MKQLCHKCNKLKEDATSYVFQSQDKVHTYWAFSLCISCRDDILASLLVAKEPKIQSDKLPSCHVCGNDDNVTIFCTECGQYIIDQLAP